MQTTVIKFGKVRSFFLLLILLLYDLIGIGLIFNGVSFFIGIGLLAYFGSQTWKVGRMFLGIDPALVIDHEGIIDNSRWISVGRIKWEEIASIKTQKVFLVFNVIAISLKDPYSFIGKQKNIFKKWSLLWRQITRQSNIQIQPQLLAISYNQLANILLKIDLDNPSSLDLSGHLIE